MARTELLRVIPDAEPGALRRFADAVRSYMVGPLTSRSPELAKWFGASPASSGVNVTEASALTFSAVWAAVRLLSDDVASLPLLTYQEEANGARQRATKHPIYNLLRYQPNPEMTAMTFRQTMQAHVLLWGNAYAEIERDVVGRPIALWPLTPDRVHPFRDSAGRLQYRTLNPSGGEITIDPRDMLHIKGLGFDGIVGYSVVGKARESIGLGMAAEEFGARFFGNGASLGGVISFQGPKPPETSETSYREKFDAEHRGLKKAHQFLALYNGAKYERMGIPPEDAQFLETRTFQVTEIARWFKLPAHKIADLTHATYSNISSQQTDYYVMSLRPWLISWEEELMSKLLMPGERERIYIEHLPEGLLRGDPAGRAAFYKEMYSIRAITSNEVRQRENLNPLPGGDSFETVPPNTTT